MSFFTRTALVVALVAGAVHVFRKDIVKIAGVIKRPAQNFVKDVQDEMKKGSTSADVTSGTPSLPTSSEKPTSNAAPTEAKQTDYEKKLS